MAVTMLDDGIYAGASFDGTGLDDLVASGDDGEVGRVASQIYLVVYPKIQSTHRALVRLLAEEEPGFVSVKPHDHADEACLWCAMDYPGHNTLDLAILAEVLECHNISQWTTRFSSRKSAVTRMTVTEPQDYVLSRIFGPYWYDVLALALTLAHAPAAERARLIHDLPQREFVLRVDDSFRYKHQCMWLAEHVVASWKSPAATRGIPVDRDVTGTTTSRIAAELYARSLGGLVGTGITDVLD